MNIKNQIKKDVNEFIRKSKLNGQKTFTKEYFTPEGFVMTLTVKDKWVKLSLDICDLHMGVEDTVDHFDNVWLNFLATIDYCNSELREGYMDSFAKIMGEHIKLDGIKKPFVVKNKNDDRLNFNVDLMDGDRFPIFAWLFEGCYGMTFGKALEEYILPSAGVIRKALAQPKLPKEITLKSKDNRMVYNPSTRIGRYFQMLAKAY